MRQTPVRLDDETFDQLRRIATKQKRSFSAVLRDMVEWGLQDFQSAEGPRI
jgi:predicted transcriptional regulator